jgi:GTPase SAR1 family protein
MIVYDTTNLQSFQEIEGYWINEIKSNADKEIQIILVGTKTDLERQVPFRSR